MNPPVVEHLRNVKYLVCSLRDAKNQIVILAALETDAETAHLVEECTTEHR